MAHISDTLVVTGIHGGDRSYSITELINVLDGGGGGGGGGTLRTDQVMTYFSTSESPTVHYTALDTDGVTVITARTTTGVSQIGSLPMWKYTQIIDQYIDMIIVWDEGDVNDYIAEWVVIDT